MPARLSSSDGPAIVKANAGAGRLTDIVGYTALMGKDEDKAFQIFRMNRDIQRSAGT
jgi:hypothetical protein